MHWGYAMPKLNCENNRHPLGGDFSMYYRGTYVSSFRDGGLQIMLVDEVTHQDDGTSLRDLRFSGLTYGPKGVELGYSTWNGDEVDFSVPKAGYRCYGAKKTPIYVSYMAQNRTNRKGVTLDSIFTNPRINISNEFIFNIFSDEPFEGRVSRDMVVSKGNILWKNHLHVGTFNDGVVTIFKKHEAIKEYVCKLLARSSEIREVLVSQE